ncbi:MAG: rRNA pseudouridine synthase [Saprospiraceae bacterium]|nr:rRNA pseudouridine synthase [Saprospiraceae bacterium]
MRDDNKLANREKISKKIEPTVVFPMRLNKYVAHCGICARRKAAELVKEGQIWINGVQEFNPSYFVVEKDEVTYKNKVLKPEEKFVYILMNKPKGVITTSQDEKDRKTVLDIIGQTSARIFPVGRLDRDTTGLLLLTNDGDLTKKLSHPSYKVKKVYDVKLNETVSKDDLAKIAAGIILDDGKAEVDGVSYIDGENRNQVQITLHIGKNRVIRRIFESLGYDVIKLDRVYYAGLTKKDLPRGKYRFLNEREVIMLKHFT